MNLLGSSLSLWFLKTTADDALLAEATDSQLTDMIGRAQDPALLRSAIVAATERNSAGVLGALVDRVEEYDNSTPNSSEIRSPAWILAAVRALAQSDRPRARALLDRLSGRWDLEAAVALALAEAGSRQAIPLLEGLMAGHQDDILRSRIAAMMKNTFDLDQGLKVFATELASSSRKRFQHAFDAFFMVRPERRGEFFVGTVIDALRRQGAVDHVVALMHLLQRSSSTEPVIEALSEYLEDKRPGKDLLSPRAKGLVRDFASHYLASNLWPDKYSRRPKALAWFSQRALRLRVQREVSRRAG